MSEPLVTDISTMTPAEIDARLADLWKKEQLARHHAASYLRYEAEERRRGLAYRADEYTRAAANYRAEAEQHRSDARPFEEEFRRRGGWHRYFLVTNGNGHVHRNMDCKTCFDTTQYHWLVELSDCDEAAMVAEWGEKACTVCFPDAPTLKGFGDGTSGQAKRTQAEKDARKAEKAARDAAKAAKAITAPDGSPLRDAYSVVATKVGAQRALAAAIRDYSWYGPTHPTDYAGVAVRMVEALEAVGIDTKPIIERAKKTMAREGAPHEWRGPDPQ